MGSEPILPRDLGCSPLLALLGLSLKVLKMNHSNPPIPHSHPPSCSTTPSILVPPPRTISPSPCTSASRTPSRSYSSSSAPLRLHNTRTPPPGYPRPPTLTTPNPTHLPMTLRPLPSPPPNPIAPPPPSTAPRLARRPLIIVTRPSTTRIAPVNVESASGATRSIRKTWPPPVRPSAFRFRPSSHRRVLSHRKCQQTHTQLVQLLRLKSEKIPMAIWPTANRS